MWFVPFTLRDFIDILLVAIAMHWVYRSWRGSKAPYILTAIIALYVLWVVVHAFNLELFSSILGQILSVGIIALIVLLQPEIRRSFQNITFYPLRFKIISRLFNVKPKGMNSAILPVVEVAAILSRSHRGGIIVLEQLSDLGLVSRSGVAIDGKLSTPLLLAIFGEQSQLKDGAVVISSGRIVAAKCMLPITQSEVSLSMGMRQRAAIGLSEISDATIVIISAHTGQISVSRAGNLTEDLSADELAQELMVGVDNETRIEEEVAR